MSKNNFENYISEYFYPNGIVYSTSIAKNIIKKNNLTPSEFLRPFFDFKNKKILVRYLEQKSNKYANTLTSFKIDLYDAENFKKYKEDRLNYYIDRMLENKNLIPQWSLNNADLNKEYLGDIAPSLKFQSLPWLNELEKLIFEIAKFNEAEMFQQPIINIYFCSVNDNANSIYKLIENVPDLIKHEIYENFLFDIIIILNDYSDNNLYVMKDKFEAISNSFHNTYKNLFPHNKFICLDINKENYANIKNNNNTNVNDIWSNYLHPIEIYDLYYEHEKKMFTQLNINKITNIKGLYISKNEINDLYNLFYNCFIESILPSIQKLIAELELDINKNKKNLITKFKKDGKSEKNNFYDILRLNYYEKKLYLLCVYCFYFHDYENCFKYAKMLKSEIKGRSDKIYHAISQLYIIAEYMTSKEKDRDKIDYMNTMNKYIEGKEKIFLIRCIFISIKFFEYSNNFNKVINLLDNIPINLLTVNYFFAFLKEKKSLIYISKYNNIEKKLKKFILFIILSGGYYTKIENYNRYYYVNCYGYLCKILSVENDSPYSLSYPRTKIVYLLSMAQSCFFINNFEASIIFYQNIIKIYQILLYNFKNCEYGLTEDNLSKLYDEFQIALNSYNKPITYTDLLIPNIDLSTIVVIESQDYEIRNMYLEGPNKNDFFINHCYFSDFYKYLNTFGITMYGTEHAFITKNDQIIIEFLDKQLIQDNNKNFCLYRKKRKFIMNQGDYFYFKFTLKNPVSRDFEFKNISLLIDVLGDNTIKKKNIEDLNKSKNGNLDIKVNDKDNLSEDSDNENIIEYSPVSITIGKHQEKTVLLKVKILKPFAFKIKGIQMNLFNKVTNQIFFNDKRRNKVDLYSHKYKSTHMDRRNSVNSLNFKPYQEVLNIKNKEIIFDILPFQKQITCELVQGRKYTLFQNEMFLIPIKIKNMYSDRIKNVCIFIENIKEKLNKKNQFFIIKYLHRSLPFQKEKTFYIPVIFLKYGEFYGKIIVKFEEELFNKDIEIRRFLVKFNVKPVILNFMTEQKIILNDKIENLNYYKIGLTVTLKNDKFNHFEYFNYCDYSLFKNNKNLLYNLEQKTQWEKFNLLKKEIYSSKLLISKCPNIIKDIDIRNVEYCEEYFNLLKNELFLKNERDESVIDDTINIIKTFLSEKLIKENNVILPLQLIKKKENSKRTLNLINFFEINMKANLCVSYKYIYQIIMDNISYNYEIINQDDQNDFIININLIINVNNKIINHLFKSFSLKLINIDNFNLGIQWFGNLNKKIIISNKDNNNNDYENQSESVFTCFIKNKGTYELDGVKIFLTYRNQNDYNKLNSINYPFKIII